MPRYLLIDFIYQSKPDINHMWTVCLYSAFNDNCDSIFEVFEERFKMCTTLIQYLPNKSKSLCKCALDQAKLLTHIQIRLDICCIVRLTDKFISCFDIEYYWFMITNECYNHFFLSSSRMNNVPFKRNWKIILLRQCAN